MKCALTCFLSFIIIMFHINVSVCLTTDNENFLENKRSNDIFIDKQKLIQCSLCQEMFEFNFNYEEFLKSNKIGVIRKAFELIQETKDEFKGYFSSDNLEFVTKEISIQYFFKGTEGQIDEANALKMKDCKVKREERDECDKMRLEVCERVLAFEQNLCIDIKNHFKSLMLQIREKKKKSTPIMDLKKPNLGKDELVSKYSNSEHPINFNKMKFKQLDMNDKDPEVIKQFGEISLIDMTPEYIQKNFDSIPKTHWKPPKPVLLENFERNIGDQLKEISLLASEIARLENRLKTLKQQLANKLEVAQTSYNAVQKTLSEISKMVNQPNLPSVIKSPSLFTEDDWDESSKPKFLK